MSETITTPGNYSVTAGPSITFSAITSNATNISFTASGSTPPPPTCDSFDPSSADYTTWVEPNLAAIEKILNVLSKPWIGAHGSYGLHPTLAMTAGANIEPSPAIGVSAGYNLAVVAIDNNLEGGASADFWTTFFGKTPAVSSVTQLSGWEANTRYWLGKPWDAIGGNKKPFPQITYDGHDRREAKLGCHSPYYASLKSSSGYISPTGSAAGTGGQVFYQPGYETVPPNATAAMTAPLLVSELPTGGKIVAGTGTNANMEELGPYISLLWIQGNKAEAQTLLTQAAPGVPGSSTTRNWLHFIHVARFTGLWQTVPQIETALKASITNVWMLAAKSIDGGLSQQTASGANSDTPEPNFQAMIAFDPRVPSWGNSG